MANSDTANEAPSPVPRMAVMCCVCKKVKDENGEWHSSDPSLREYTGDVFSHGYCDECRAKTESKLNALDTVRPRNRG